MISKQTSLKFNRAREYLNWVICKRKFEYANFQGAQENSDFLKNRFSTFS